MSDLDPLEADFASKYPDSFARVLGRASSDDISTVLNKLPPAVKASIVARLPGSLMNQLLDSGKHTPVQWLADASFDDAVTFLSRIPRERRLALVNSLGDRQLRQRLLRHEQYPTHSVGALVSDVLLRISLDANAADVVHELREMEGDDPVAMVVVDSDGRYSGLLNLWRLLASDLPVGKIRDYIREIEAIYPETPIASAVQNEAWLKYNWLPVVDQKQRVLGGVSRAKLFRAATANRTREQSAANVIFELLTESVYAFGALLERVLTSRSSP
jgi:Mg/Co/Ni transporter MgtE